MFLHRICGNLSQKFGSGIWCGRSGLKTHRKKNYWVCFHVCESCTCGSFSFQAPPVLYHRFLLVNYGDLHCRRFSRIPAQLKLFHLVLIRRHSWRLNSDLFGFPVCLEDVPPTRVFSLQQIALIQFERTSRCNAKVPDSRGTAPCWSEKKLLANAIKNGKILMCEFVGRAGRKFLSNSLNK